MRLKFSWLAIVSVGVLFSMGGVAAAAAEATTSETENLAVGPQYGTTHVYVASSRRSVARHRNAACSR
jgi:hypothetical protein